MPQRQKKKPFLPQKGTKDHASAVPPAIRPEKLPKPAPARFFILHGALQRVTASPVASYSSGISQVQTRSSRAKAPNFCRRQLPALLPSLKRRDEIRTTRSLHFRYQSHSSIIPPFSQEKNFPLPHVALLPRMFPASCGRNLPRRRPKTPPSRSSAISQ